MLWGAPARGHNRGFKSLSKVLASTCQGTYKDIELGQALHVAGASLRYSLRLSLRLEYSSEDTKARS
jgi:hypothetical protein